MYKTEQNEPRKEKTRGLKASLMTNNVVGFTVANIPEFPEFLLQQVSGLIQSDLNLSTGAVLCPVGFYRQDIESATGTTTTAGAARIAGGSSGSSQFSLSFELGLNNDVLYKVVFIQSNNATTRYCVIVTLKVIYTQLPTSTGANLHQPTNKCKSSRRTTSRNPKKSSARFVTTSSTLPYNPYANTSRRNSMNNNCHECIVVGATGATGATGMSMNCCNNQCGPCGRHPHTINDFSCFLFGIIKQDLMARLCLEQNHRLFLLVPISVVSTSSQSTTNDPNNLDQQVTQFLIQFTDGVFNYQATIQSTVTILQVDIINNASNTSFPVCEEEEKSHHGHGDNHENNNNNCDNHENNNQNCMSPTSTMPSTTTRNIVLFSALGLLGLGAVVVFACPGYYHHYNNSYYCRQPRLKPCSVFDESCASSSVPRRRNRKKRRNRYNRDPCYGDPCYRNTAQSKQQEEESHLPHVSPLSPLFEEAKSLNLLLDNKK